MFWRKHESKPDPALVNQHARETLEFTYLMGKDGAMFRLRLLAWGYDQAHIEAVIA